jgi:hypothetical protein
MGDWNMIRLRLIAALAVLFVAPGAAQVTNSLPPLTPMTVSPQAMPQFTPLQVDRDATTKILTADEAKAQIAKLENEQRETRIQLKAALERIEQMTKIGGSQVQAYCEPGTTMSRNTAGASENCATSGFACDKVSGLCHRRAVNTEMCAIGYVAYQGSCVTPASMPNETD